MTQGFKDVMTQSEVETKIESLLDAIEIETEKLAGLGWAMGDAEVAHKVARGKAFLVAEGTMDQRNAIVDSNEEVSKLLLARRIAEVNWETQRERLRTMRTQIDGYRSINVNAREAIG